jgi:TatD DNase family protein
MFDFLVDSHCHLNMLQDERGMKIADVVANATANGVKIINNIATSVAEFDLILSVANDYENVFATIGVHPSEIKETKDLFGVLMEFMQKKKVIGIGESGLDYHYEPYDKKQQRENFEVHIEVARKTGKPLIIHSRDADNDMMEILKSEMKNGEFKFLLHSFSSGKELCDLGLDLGGYVSLSGIVTFKNANDVREKIRDIPLDRLLMETDSPFLAPDPYRGQCNQPAYTRNTAEYLANFYGVEFDNFQDRTTGNFYRLFGNIIEN